MTLQEMLKNNLHKEAWDKYCGFLDLTIDEFMEIQERLLRELTALTSDKERSRFIEKLP